jgi:hypothetical protein
LIGVDATIVLVRDPLEVAASLAARDEIDPPRACLLWLRYLLAAIENDVEGHLLVDHAAFFDDPEGILCTIADHLALPQPDDDAMATVRTHLDPTLRHHIAPTAAPDDNANPIVSLARAVWNGGAITTDGLPPAMVHALARGWFRSPVETEAFDRERARNVDLTELLRRRSRARARFDDGDDDGDAASQAGEER